MRICFIIRVLEGNTPPLQYDDWQGLDCYLCFYMSSMQLLQKEYVFHCWLSMFPPRATCCTSRASSFLPPMFDMLLSEGQLALLQNEIGF